MVLSAKFQWRHLMNWWDTKYARLSSSKLMLRERKLKFWKAPEKFSDALKSLS